MNKRQFYKNSASGIIQLVFTALLTILCIPIFIHKLGSVAYGIFAIVSLIGNLNVLANLGINVSLIKYIAQQGKCKESDYDIAITLLLLILILSPITILLLLLKNFFLLNIFKIPLVFLNDSGTLYLCMLFSNVLLLLGQTFNAILSSQQKIYINNILQMFYNSLYWTMIIVILLVGYGLKEIGYAILLSSIIWFTLLMTISLKSWGQLELHGISHHYKRIMVKQLSYGAKIYFSGLINLFFEPLTKILISHFIGIKEVGYFDIAIKIRSQLQGLVTRLFDPFFPYISQITDYNKLRILVNDVAQKYFLLSLPLISMLIFCIQPLLQIWLGDNSNDQISTTTIIISCTYIFSMASIPIYMYLASKNHAGKTIIIQASNVLVNVLVIISLHKLIGFYAIAVGNAFAVFVSFFICTYFQYIYLNNYIFNSVKQIFHFFLFFAILIITNGIIYFVSSGIVLKLILIPISTVILSILLANFLKLITKNDIARYFGNENYYVKKMAHFFSA